MITRLTGRFRLRGGRINRNDLPRRTGYCWQAGDVGERVSEIRAKAALAELPMGAEAMISESVVESPGQGRRLAAFDITASYL